MSDYYSLWVCWHDMNFSEYWVSTQILSRVGEWKWQIFQKSEDLIVWANSRLFISYYRCNAENVCQKCVIIVDMIWNSQNLEFLLSFKLVCKMQLSDFSKIQDLFEFVNMAWISLFFIIYIAQTSFEEPPALKNYSVGRMGDLTRQISWYFPHIQCQICPPSLIFLLIIYFLR